MKGHPLILRIFTIAAPAVILSTATPGVAQILGTAGNYGVLGYSTVTNTGGTVVTGDLGVSPGTAITGFSAIDGGPGLFSGAANQGNAPAAQAQADATTAYTSLAALSYTADLSGVNLGGLTLTPGVYFFSSSAQLTGTLTLNAENNPNALFVFQIGSTLTTAGNSVVNVINANPASGPDSGLYWQVGSSATLGTGTLFAGSILAFASITLDTGASIDDGRALALNGAVTLDDNLIDAGNSDGGFGADGSGLTPVPEAGAYGLAGSCLLLFAAWRRQTAGRRNCARA
jgi:type VI secretion system secreted protein VgrG